MFPHSASRRRHASRIHPLFEALFGHILSGPGGFDDFDDVDDPGGLGGPDGMDDDSGGRRRHRRGRRHHHRGRGPRFSGPFSGRRPLRFLARRLGLDESQVATIARVLSDLKTERDQLKLDSRRAAAHFADALAADEFDEARVKEGQTSQEDAHRRYLQAFSRAFREIHAVLDSSQRRKLSMLIREMPPWAL